MPDSNEIQKLQRSREADEIFGKLPSWVIRWGVTVIAAILLAIIIACCIIRYPQTIKSRIVLTCDNPPSDLVARYSGILDSVYVADGDAVAEGDLIALISTPASYGDIRTAETLIRVIDDSLTTQNANHIVHMLGLHLGDLQSEWISLQRSCSDYLNWLDLNQAGRKIVMLESLEKESDEYTMLLENQRNNVQENVQFASSAFSRDSSLYSRQLISQSEYEKSLMELNSRKNELTSLDASLTNARMSLLELRRQVVELRLQQSSEELGYQQDIHRAYRQLELVHGRKHMHLSRRFPERFPCRMCGAEASISR